jgi:DNA-binding MarR family transcriptional regulator
MEEQKILSTLEEIRAFSDPYRLQILSHFENISRPATVKQIADLMKEIPSKVHYHVKKMEKYGLLHIVHTEEINGIVAKYYEPTAEEFIIKHKKHGDSIDKVALSEAERTISILYDESKNMVIKQLGRMAELDKEKDTKKDLYTGGFMSDEIYLTHEEAQEVSELLKTVNKKYGNRKKTDNEETIKYHLFTVIMPVIDE